MAGINLSQLNIPKSEEPVKRKHVVRLDELSDSYSNPEKKKENLIDEQPSKMRDLRYVRGVENEPVKKGELTKPESKIERLDKQLEKVENRTSDLITKHVIKEEAKAKKVRQSTTDSTQSTHKLAINSPQTINKIKREASFYAYICMPPRKLPRKILDHIKANAWAENGEWFSRIDSYELSLVAEINAHQIGNTVRQLKNEGFFEVIEHSTSGYRLLKINPIIFGIKHR